MPEILEVLAGHGKVIVALAVMGMPFTFGIDAILSEVRTFLKLTRGKFQLLIAGVFSVGVFFTHSYTRLTHHEGVGPPSGEMIGNALLDGLIVSLGAYLVIGSAVIVLLLVRKRKV
jgi:hypothetical protein